MTCTKCGTQNPDGFRFCLRCGETLSVTAQEAPAPSATIAMPMDAIAFAPAALAGRLRVEEGPFDQPVFELGVARLVIGRRLGSDIVIHDPNVSRHHADIYPDDDGGFMIEDANSANGTIVNDEPLQAPYRLQPGDVIRVGEGVLVYESGVAVPAVAAPPPAVDSGMTIFAPPPSLDFQGVVDNAPHDVGVSDAPPLPPSEHTSFEPVLVEPVSQVADDDRVIETTFDVGIVDAGIVDAGAPPTSDALGDTVDQLAALKSDLAAVSGDLAKAVERLSALESSIRSAGQRIAPLQELQGSEAIETVEALRSALAAFVAAGGGTKSTEIQTLVNELVEKPRDIDVLLKLSQRASELSELLRAGAALVALMPRVRPLLDKLLR